MICHFKGKFQQFPNWYLVLKRMKNIQCKPNTQEIEKIFFFLTKIFTQRYLKKQE